jgi:NADPH:quinone reductase
LRAFTLDSFDSTPGLRDDLPEPQAVDTELVVRVLASSANPVDAAIAGGVLRQMAEHEFPVTLGRDYAGIVEYAGSDTTRYRAGDEVYGFVPATNPSVHDGSWAELIVVPESGWVARRPASIELEAAGASPLAGITALAALDALQPGDGETVLVIGATGGVGSFFVQLASLAGANVVAPGLAEDADYLTGIGVGEILDRDGDLAAALDGRQVDAILDVVSFAPQETLLSATTRLASSNGAAGDGPGRFNLYAQPSLENLERLAGLLDAGTIRVSIQERFELAQAGEALGFLAAGHTRGKVAVSVG